MKDPKKLEEKIKCLNHETITTKRLESLGVSKYYIKKFMDKGLLKRTKRGVYTIDFISVKARYYQNFNLYRKSIEEQNYSKAYENLKWCYENTIYPTNHNYFFIYFSLLKEIIGDNYDFSMLEELDTHRENNVNAEENNEWLNYIIKCIIKKDYRIAYKYIQRLNYEEFVKTGHTPVNRILIEQLLNKINKQKINNSKFEYNQFKQAFKNGDFSGSLEHLKRNLAIDKNDKSEKKELLFILLNGWIQIVNGEIDFNENKGIKYQGSPRQIVTSAIRKRDFLVAFRNIGVCTYQNKDEELNMMKTILHAMFTESKTMTEKKKQNLLRLKMIDNNINKVIQGTVIFDENTIIELKTLYLQRQNIVFSEKIQNFLNIIDMILFSKEGKISQNDFAKLTKSGNDEITNFRTALENGDYLSAWEIINKIDWKYLKREYDIKTLQILKYLLNTMIFYMNKKKSISELHNEYLLEIAEYTELISLVELGKTKEAFELYRKHSFSLDEKNEISIAANLAFLMSNPFDEAKKENCRLERNYHKE